MNRIVDRLLTDRQHLTTAAYPDSKNLGARMDIFRYQQPYIDIVGWTIAQVPWSGSERVLDVGCGPGVYLRRLAQRRDLHLLGMDLSPGMLRDLQRDWGAYGDPPPPVPHLAVADVQTLPLPDASCDAILAMHMLYHVPDLALAARELRRILRPGGTLLAATNSVNHFRELDVISAAAVTAVSAQPAAGPGRGRFALENGAAILQTAFKHVARRDVTGELQIPEVEPIRAFLASRRSWMEAALPPGVAWDAVMVELERSVTAIIAREGVFRVTTHAGVFVCQ